MKSDRASHRTPRRLVATALLAALALAVSLIAQTASGASPSPLATADRVVHLCNQSVSVGHYACFAERRASVTPASRSRDDAAANTPDGYGPDDLQNAYDLGAAAAAASNQRVYVVDAYDDPTAESDLAVYRSQYGLPACTTANGCFQKLNQAGSTSPLPATDTGWAGEIALDLQMVSAVCPHCGITLVESDDDSENIFQAVRTATDLGAKFVSMSWGGDETGDEPDYDSSYLAASGVVYTAATGDNAYAAGANYPATSPRVVAVGGTSLTADSSARGWTESAWSGAGSGCSASETKPSWQAVVTAGTCANRANADVSAVADPNTGVAVYDTTGGTGWGVFGGTSAAAPIIAATYALAGTPASGATPAALPYSHTSALNDVTTGSNGTCTQSALCTAGAGWDGPTGLGTPDGVDAFRSTAAATATNSVALASPGTQSSVLGTPDRLQLRATDSASPTPTYSASNLPTGLTLNPTSGLISGTPRTPGSRRVTVGATDFSGGSASTSFLWNVAQPVSCAGNVVTNSGFESGTSGWRTGSHVVRRSASAARHGARYAALDGYGHKHTDTLTRAIVLPAGCRATLRYDLRVISKDTSKKAHDVLTVSVNGRTVAHYSNRNRSGHYSTYGIDLSRYAGRRITLKFVGKENGSKATTFRLDDITVTLSR